MSPLLYVGITQNCVPVGIRERIHADSARCRKLVCAASGLADGVLVLSTCERFEVYAATPSPDPATWLTLLAREFGFSTDALSVHVRVLAGDAVAQHMLRVASGLESRLLGERQIHLQLRNAYLEGLARGELDPVLSALGRAAIYTGKRVRRETTLAAAGGSIIDLAIEKLGADAMSTRSRVVMLGTGTLACQALARLTGNRTRDIAIVSRDVSRARNLAERFGASPYALEHLSAALHGASALLTCTASPDGFVVTRRAVSARRTAPLRIVDLGMPRNVDPDLAAIPGIELVPLERLHAFTRAPEPVITAATAIVARELARFHDWMQARQAAGKIAALCAAADDAPTDRQKLHARIARIKSQVAA